MSPALRSVGRSVAGAASRLDNVEELIAETDRGAWQRGRQTDIDVTLNVAAYRPNTPSIRINTLRRRIH